MWAILWLFVDRAFHHSTSISAAIQCISLAHTTIPSLTLWRERKIKRVRHPLWQMDCNEHRLTQLLMKLLCSFSLDRKEGARASSNGSKASAHARTIDRVNEYIFWVAPALFCTFFGIILAHFSFFRVFLSFDLIINFVVGVFICCCYSLLIPTQIIFHWKKNVDKNALTLKTACGNSENCMLHTSRDLNVNKSA